VTTPAPCPASLQEPSSQAAGTVDKRSRKVYVLWGVALTLLLTLGIFCWTVVVPVWRTCREVEECREENSSSPELKAGVNRLGGPARAARWLGVYLRLPEALAEHPGTAADMLRYCGKHGRIAVPQLVLLLEHGNREDVRTKAIISLGHLRDRRAVPALRRGLRDPSHEVRAWCAVAMGQIGGPGVYETLIGVLKEGKRLKVQVYALSGLAALGDARAIEPMKKARTELHGDTAAHASQMLEALLRRLSSKPQRTFSKSTTATLESLAQDEEEDVGIRLAAASALGQFEALVSSLEESLTDEDRYVRYDAAMALGIISREAVTAIPALEKALKDKEPQVRRAAASALKKIRAAEQKDK